MADAGKSRMWLEADRSARRAISRCCGRVARDTINPAAPFGIARRTSRQRPLSAFAARAKARTLRLAQAEVRSNTPQYLLAQARQRASHVNERVKPLVNV